MKKQYLQRGKSYSDIDEPDIQELKKRFTNRKSLINLFENKLKQDSQFLVLSYFGLGGSGKTYFLHFIRSKYCISKKKNSKSCPSAYINFRSGYTPINTLNALSELRRQLENPKKGFTFPRFDILSRKFQERNFIPVDQNPELIQKKPKWLRGLLDLMGLIPFIGQYLQLPWLKWARVIKRNRYIRKSKDWFKVYIEDEYQLEWEEAIDIMKLGDLEDLLPKAFAADLAEAISKIEKPHEKVILFIDTFENIQANLKETTQKKNISFIQILSEELLQLEANIILLIAGKNKLRWAESQLNDGQWKIDEMSIWSKEIETNNSKKFVSTYLEQYLVDKLTEADSIAYLMKQRQITDKKLAQRIYEITDGFPLGLGVVVDLLQESDEQILKNQLVDLRSQTSVYKPFSEEWINELLGWLLKKLIANKRELLYVAAIPRWFNKKICSRLKTEYDFLEFKNIISYTFITSYEKDGRKIDDKAYSFHPTVRRLLLRDIRINNEERYKDLNHKALKYFESLPQTDNEKNFAHKVEALYHKAIIDSKEGLRNFTKIFYNNLKKFYLTRSELLLDAMWDLHIWSDNQKAQIFILAGRLNLAKAKYEIALDNFKKAETTVGSNTEYLRFRRVTSLYIAECNRLLGNYPDALSITKEVLRIEEKPENIPLIWMAKFRLSLTYKLLDNISKAIDLNNELVQIWEKNKDNTQTYKSKFTAFGITDINDINARIAHVYRDRAKLLRYSGNYMEASSYCKSSQSVGGDSLNTPADYYNILTLSHISRMEGDIDAAQSYAKQAYNGFSNLKEPRGKLSAYRALGQTNYLCEAEPKAKKYFNKILTCSTKVYPYGPIYGHLGMGEICRISKDLRTAEDHYIQASKLCQGLGGKVETAYANLGLAEIARVKGNNENALYKIKESVEIGQSSGIPWIEVYANLLGAIVSNDKSNFLEEAIKASERIKRRKNDQNYEKKKITYVKNCLNNNKHASPFRFNFL